MEEFSTNIEGLKEAKKAAFNVSITSLQGLIFQRYEALTSMGSISFAVAGVTLSINGDVVQCRFLAVFSMIIFIVVALGSLGRHLYLVRRDISEISKRIKGLAGEDWSKPIKEKAPRVDFWPEIMYFLLVVGVIFFGLSLIP